MNLSDRREFLKGTAWMGFTAMAAGCINNPLKTGCAGIGAPMHGKTLGRKLDTVRVACIGVGARGIGAVHRIAQIPGTQVTVIADLFQDRLDSAQQKLVAIGKPKAKLFVGPESYKRACECDDVDVIYSVTPWHLHAPIAKYAMEHGKVALTEVPGCITVEECWDLVETSERTGMPCMMLENCVYGEYEMLFFNLIKKGLLGEIVHGEAGYIHDQRSLQYGGRYHSMDGDKIAGDVGKPGWALYHYAHHSGNWYPTHGLGPVCWYMDINRGDRFDFLCSLDSKQANYYHYAQQKYPGTFLEKYPVKMGDMNISIIKTVGGKSILLEHDVASPRPYTRLNVVSGTKGVLMGYPDLKMTWENACGDGATHEFFNAEKTEQLRQQYKHPFWKVAGEIAKKVGGHGGMDFIMDLRWSYCLQNNLPLDTDVYDLASWSAMVELTERSVDNNSRPVDVPDFTRGGWKTAKPFTVDEIDLKLLHGFLGEGKSDADVRKTAESEGFKS